jgi:predicted short-subunit dehydrogenase-like oxidoreductase (DUF2520 family)
LAHALVREGRETIFWHSRRAVSARRCRDRVGRGEVYDDPSEAAGGADLVLCTVPDDAIASLCSEVASGGGFHEGQLVVHCSGFHGASILRKAEGCGAGVGAMHPMQTFAGAWERWVPLAGVAWGCDGAPEALDRLREIVSELQGFFLNVPEAARPWYHLAGVWSSNYLGVLASLAMESLRRAGVPDRDASSALGPIMRETLRNLEERGIAGAVGGPIARGDQETLQGHLRVLEEGPPGRLELYRALARELAALLPGGAYVKPTRHPG